MICWPGFRWNGASGRGGDVAPPHMEGNDVATGGPKGPQFRQAEADQASYDSLNFRDDQFDLSDASIAIAISLLAVASLTQLTWLYMVALIPSGFGVLMGLSGLFGWNFHPDALIKLLS